MTHRAPRAGSVDDGSTMVDDGGDQARTDDEFSMTHRVVAATMRFSRIETGEPR
jgi:hypothetical protein